MTILIRSIIVAVFFIWLIMGLPIRELKKPLKEKCKTALCVKMGILDEKSRF